MYEPFYLKDGNNYVQLLFHEILYIESRDKYTRVVTPKRKYLIRLPLHHVERWLPGRYFCRINRSQIISVLHTTTFNNLHVIVGGKKLHVGKQYKIALLNRVIGIPNDSMNFIPLSDYDLLTMIRRLGLN